MNFQHRQRSNASSRRVERLCSDCTFDNLDNADGTIWECLFVNDFFAKRGRISTPSCSQCQDPLRTESLSPPSPDHHHGHRPKHPATHHHPSNIPTTHLPYRPIPSQPNPNDRAEMSLGALSKGGRPELLRTLLSPEMF